MVETGRILVELPGAKDLDRVEKLITQTAQLEFWETLKPEELGNFFTAANEVLKVTDKKLLRLSRKQMSLKLKIQNQKLKIY